MAEIVVFEIDVQAFFNFLGMIFHRIDGLDFAIQQRIDEREGKERIFV